MWRGRLEGSSLYIKARDVKYVILGDIPEMGRARLVRIRRPIKVVEVEEEG